MPTRSEVLRLLDRYRKAIAARNSVDLTRLAFLWNSIEKNLGKDMELLAYQIVEAKAAGSVITEQLLWRMERYRGLREDLRTQILRLARGDAPRYIAAEQRALARLGMDYAQGMITTLGSGILFKRLSIASLTTYAGLLGDGTPLYRLLQEAYPYALDGVIKGLLDGTARGMSPQRIARLMAENMGVGLGRITRIARTEQMRAFRQASVEQYRESGVCDGYIRIANKSTACLACLLLDGTELENEDDLEDHPNGGCNAIPKVIGAAPLEWELGRDWLEKQSEERQREIMGDGRFELWKGGEDLQNFVTMNQNETWGASPALVPVEEFAIEE